MYESAVELITKKITPTKPIRDLLDDALLQAWVKDGASLHKDKRESCGFCGQILPVDLWDKLDEHFSKESTDLEKEIQKVIEYIDKESELLEELLSLEVKRFYSIFHSSFNEAKDSLEGEVGKYRAVLGEITRNLSSRKGDIFSIGVAPEVVNNIDNINKKIEVVNGIIDKNNEMTGSLTVDQENARTELRRSEISQFIQDINLNEEKEKISILQKESNSIKSKVDSLHSAIQVKEKRVAELQLQHKDEKKGADKVNEYLNQYFGHDGLHLVAEELGESSLFKFQITRGDTPAYNLSEGECSLVAFCYFIAKLEDAESEGKNLVIYIDDPISSLDSNHIFF